MKKHAKKLEASLRNLSFLKKRDQNCHLKILGFLGFLYKDSIISGMTHLFKRTLNLKK